MRGLIALLVIGLSGPVLADQSASAPKGKTRWRPSFYKVPPPSRDLPSRALVQAFQRCMAAAKEKKYSKNRGLKLCGCAIDRQRTMLVATGEREALFSDPAATRRCSEFAKRGRDNKAVLATPYSSPLVWSSEEVWGSVSQCFRATGKQLAGKYSATTVMDHCLCASATLRSKRRLASPKATLRQITREDKTRCARVFAKPKAR